MLPRARKDGTLCCICVCAERSWCRFVAEKAAARAVETGTRLAVTITLSLFFLKLLAWVLSFAGLCPERVLTFIRHAGAVPSAGSVVVLTLAVCVCVCVCVRVCVCVCVI